MLAYDQAKKFSRHPERFGKGAVEGVLGPGAANNSKEGGSLIPTLAFGVPGSVSMAILLGAFDPVPPMPNDNGYGLASVMKSVRKLSPAPVVSGLPFGHVARKLDHERGARVIIRAIAQALAVFQVEAFDQQIPQVRILEIAVAVGV